MLSAIFSTKTANEILSIAQTSETAPDYLVQIVRAQRLGMYEGKLATKVQGLMDVHAGFNSQLRSIKSIKEPSCAVAEVLRYSWETKEHFLVIAMDHKHHVLGVEVISVGTDSECLADPKQIFGAAIRMNASRIIIAHNHPSGSLEASPEDILLTGQLIKAGKLLGLPVLDHLILSWGNWVSLNETTQLWQAQ